MLRMSLVIVAVMIGALIFLATMAGADARRAVNWQPIYQMNIHGAKGFIDSNSFQKTEFKGDIYTSASIMISYDSPFTSEVHNQKYTYRSIVKEVLIECNSGIAIPISDFYFKEAKPTRSSLPLVGSDYTDVAVESKTIVIDKNNPLRFSLCPIYI